MEEESVYQTLKLIEKNWPEIWKKIVPEVVLFFRIEEQLQEAIDIEAGRFGILPGDFRVLYRLCYCGPENPQSPTSLYKNLRITSGGLTKILHRLKEKRFIDRINNPNDRRSNLVIITPEGKDMMGMLADSVIDHDRRYFSVLSKEERKILTRLFEKLLRL